MEEGIRNKKKGRRGKKERRMKKEEEIKGNKKRKSFFNLLMSSSLVPVSLLLISPRMSEKLRQKYTEVPFLKMSTERLSLRHPWMPLSNSSIKSRR
jgi:hypothetical protein